MFGFQRRRVRRFECETLLPKLGPLPQMSHVDATVFLLRDVDFFYPQGLRGVSEAGARLA